ncbi:hypothetical protein [Pseudoduganella violaceinigra]|uniref:hypothetical protein n=1 Tax=Pseudoduganella violaceinigra TaxID=246602 RepID=UPI0004190B3D|nr:hypothetical protein [Pseudoduganella violaceinigra]
MRYVLFVAAMTAQAAAAAPGEASRAPTLAEQRSFAQFWQGIAPGTSAPPLQAQRAAGARQWSVSAVADAPPLRLGLPLCRVSRTRYTLGAGDSWQSASSQHVWVNHSTACGAPPATMVELRAALPEMDAFKLLLAQGELLQRARLLMSGNTSCAPMRSRNFAVVALGYGEDKLPLLVYRNDLGGLLKLSVRPARSDYLPWNVACSP